MIYNALEWVNGHRVFSLHLASNEYKYWNQGNVCWAVAVLLAAILETKS